MRRTIRKLYIVLMLVVISSLAGCTDEAQPPQDSITDNVSQKAGTVQLYHASESGIEPDAERYQLRQPDSLSATMEEIVEAITLSKGVTIERFSIDEAGSVTIYMHFDSEVTEEARLLNKAAVVRSVIGIELGEVYIVSLDDGGEEIDTATFTDSSFYYYED